MTKQIIIAYATEGTTDIRFLESIIKRTFEKIAFQCSDTIEIFDPIYLTKVQGNIKEKALKYGEQIVKSGAMIFCLHIDADHKTDQQAFNNQINPAFNVIKNKYPELSNNLVAIVTIQMTEAWMLADTEVLKSELGTNETNEKLGINKHPESFADPKQILINIIKITRENLTKRRRYKLKIDELYQPLGQKIKLENLENLSSYKKFKDRVISVFYSLNYLP
jgi:hypothetical protein